jgi:hypothetical protein
MKTIFLMTITASMLIATTFCKGKSQKDAEKYMNKSEDTLKENSGAKTDEKNANARSGTIPQGMENIVGEWELIEVIADRNDSHIIDADEDKDAITTVKDYLKLNANGTCEYTIAKLEGRYEIVTKEDGRKKLVMYDKTGTETTSGRYIISVTDKELVINRIMGGSDFEVFKRL